MKKILVVLALVALTGCRRLNMNGQLERYAGGRALWSFMIPGVGQVQNEEGGKATMLFALDLLNLATYYQDEPADRNDERLFAVMGVIHLWAETDAFNRAKELNRTRPCGMQFTPGVSSFEPSPLPPPQPTPLQLVLDPIGKRVAATLTCRF